MKARIKLSSTLLRANGLISQFVRKFAPRVAPICEVDGVGVAALGELGFVVCASGREGDYDDVFVIGDVRSGKTGRPSLMQVVLCGWIIVLNCK